MIAQIFLYLFIAGLASEVVAERRSERFLSLVLFGIVSVLMLNFYENWQEGYASAFVYEWIDSQNHRLNIDLASNGGNYALIFPFFLLSALMIFGNIFYDMENSKLRLNGIIAINLSALMLLICSRNFMQVLVAVCMIDVLSLFIINDIEAKKRYIFYNLLADMGLFTLFAIIWGQTESYDLSALSEYNKSFCYPNLCVIILLLCVFIKSGLFLFQSALLNLSGLNFNRLITVSFCSTPVAGILLLSKTYPLLEVSGYAVPLLQAFAALSIFWGFLGAISIDDIKEKTIYFNIMLYALVFGLMSVNHAQALAILPWLLVLGYLFNNLWVMVTISASNEVFVSNMGGFVHSIKISFIIGLLLFFALTQTLLKDLTPENKWWIWGTLGAVLLASAHVLRQVFLGKTNADERVWAFLKNSSFFFWLPIVGGIAYIIYSDNFYTKEVFYVFGIFLLCVVVGPLRWLDKIYDNEKIQAADLFNDIYEVLFIAPIKILGRILWLTIDFLIIERTIISSLSGSMAFMVSVSQKIHNGSKLSWFLFTFLGLAVTFGVFYWKGVK